MQKLKKVIPGDSIGPITATQSSTLFSHASHTLLLSPTALYHPQENDIAIAKAVGVLADYVKLDFGHSIKGILLSQAFLNCTKRNRPKIKVNDLLLCRVLRVKDVVFASCCEEGLGMLEEGFLLEMSSWLVKTLFVRTCVLRDIGEEYKYKIALGVNGFIWIQAKNAMVAKNVYDGILKRINQ